MTEIKSLEELRKVAMNSGEIEKNIKILVREIEEKIILGMQRSMSKISIALSTCDYQFIACDEKQGVKIILCNLLEILSRKQYTVGVHEGEQGYVIVIDISKNKKELEALDGYIRKFSIKK